MLQTDASAKLRYRIEIIRAGKLVKKLPWSKFHLITDAGLDKVGTFAWLQCISTPIMGEGVTPTAIRRDSGAITFTQSGNTLMASAGFFTAADVGRLFKWGVGSAGTELYITAFTSPTIVTVGGAPFTVSTPEVGTVWYVNTAALQTPIPGFSWTKNNDALENYSTAATAGDTCTVTNQTTFYSSAFTAAKTVTEIAFSNSSTNADVFDRDLVTPSVAFLVGDQAKITVQLIVKWSPITPVGVGNNASGYDSAGQMQIESIGMSNLNGVSHFSSSGQLSGGGQMQLEPYCTMVNIGVLTTNTAFQAFNATTPNNTGTMVAQNGTTAAYGTGNRYRDCETTFSISQANGTIYGVSIGSGATGGRLLTQRFFTPFTKLPTQTYRVPWRKSWSRILTN